MSIRQFRISILPITVFLVLVLAACSSANSNLCTIDPSDHKPSLDNRSTRNSSPAPTEVPAVSPTPAPTTAPTAQPEPTPTPQPAINYFEGVPGIVDSTNFGWPREVEGLNGITSIPSKPLRIITASVGHDEMTLALVPKERLVGVGSSTKSVTYSNVASLVQEIAEITRDPETIITQSPDVVVTSPYFAAEGIDALLRLGIPVIQTDLQAGPRGPD